MKKLNIIEVKLNLNNKMQIEIEKTSQVSKLANNAFNDTTKNYHGTDLKFAKIKGGNLFGLNKQAVVEEISKEYPKLHYVANKQTFSAKRLTFTNQVLITLFNLILYFVAFVPMIATLSYEQKFLYFVLIMVPFLLFCCDYLFFTYKQQFFAYAVFNVVIVNNLNYKRKTQNIVLGWSALIIFLTIITIGIFLLVLVYINYITNQSFLERVTKTTKFVVFAKK